MSYLIVTFFAGICIVAIGLSMNAKFYFAPIIGFMVGALYSYTDYDTGREHTLQMTLGFLSMTVQWEDLG